MATKQSESECGGVGRNLGAPVGSLMECRGNGQPGGPAGGLEAAAIFTFERHIQDSQDSTPTYRPTMFSLDLH